MNEKTLKEAWIPELGTLKKGKVRDIYENNGTLTLISSDRISIFDRILNQPIQDKGKVLTKLSLFWFQKTEDIVPNHLISHPDPNVIIVKKCQPIMVEVIVRAYLVGSLWRDYASGKRIKCGITLPEGLKENDPLPSPIITPTTKSAQGHDEDITKEQLIEKGLVAEQLWNQIEKAALMLFKRGSEIVEKRGLILVDTKYEFGLDETGKLTLIDEIHTPDSSRFWFIEDIEKKQVHFPDKELVRQWGRSQGFTGDGSIPELPQTIRDQVSRSYKDIYNTITGFSLEDEECSPPSRLLANLRKENVIRGVYCPIILGDPSLSSKAEIIKKILSDNQIPCKLTVLSGEHNQDEAHDLIQPYNHSIEPILFIILEEENGALSHSISQSTHWPVITVPLSRHDHISPVLTAENPTSAAYAALRLLTILEVK